MVNAVEFLIGLAIGTLAVSIFYLVKARQGGDRAAHYRARLNQALKIFGISAVLAIVGEIYIRMR